MLNKTKYVSPFCDLPINEVCTFDKPKQWRKGLVLVLFIPHALTVEVICVLNKPVQQQSIQLQLYIYNVTYLREEREEK